MPYAPDHKQETRARIVDSARRLFNRHGLTEISIDDIMAGAGLTRGGFYSHFSTKDELYAEAITHFVRCGPVEPWQREVLDGNTGGKSLARLIVDAYVSRPHLQDVEGSCPMLGLATDTARAGATVKAAYREVLQMMTGIFAAQLGPDAAAAREKALAVAALLVGGMALARAVDDQDLADALRAATHKAAIGMTGWEPEAAS